MNPDQPQSPSGDDPEGLEREARITAMLLGELPPAEIEALGAEIARDPKLARLEARLRKTLECVRMAAAEPVEPVGGGSPLPRLSPGRREKLLEQLRTPPSRGKDEPATVIPVEFPATELGRRVARAERGSWLAMAACAVALLATSASLLNSVRHSRVKPGLDLDGGIQVSSLNLRRSARDELSVAESQPANLGKPVEPQSPPPSASTPTEPPFQMSPQLMRRYGLVPNPGGPVSGANPTTPSGPPTEARAYRMQTPSEAEDWTQVSGLAVVPAPTPGALRGTFDKAVKGEEMVELAKEAKASASGAEALDISRIVKAPEAKADSAGTMDGLDRARNLGVTTRGRFRGGVGGGGSGGGGGEGEGASASAPAPAPASSQPQRGLLRTEVRMQALAGQAGASPNDSRFFSETMGRNVAPIQTEGGAALNFGAVAGGRELKENLSEARQKTKVLADFDSSGRAVTESESLLALGDLPVLGSALARKPATTPADSKKRDVSGNGPVTLSYFNAPAQGDTFEFRLSEAAGPVTWDVAKNDTLALAVTNASRALAALVPQPEVAATENAISTFSLNVSDVSFKLASASLESGRVPSESEIRTEEFVNAFEYRDPEAPFGRPIAFTWERAQYPFAQQRDVLRLAVKTSATGRETGRPLNLVLLLDASGSMERADRVATIREALKVLGSQLKAEDRVSVVTFARSARLWIDGLSGSQAGELVERVGQLTPEGGTHLEEALTVGYDTARRHFMPGGVNRVVLMTDGAANLGELRADALRATVESNRKRGIALDCFGVGFDGYQDDLLEALSRNGDGRYGFINSPEEAATGFVNQLAGALNVAASDVKVQVEFHPERVNTWRQIGYARHQLTREQFRDNAVDAAELGAAESGNALYIVEPRLRGQGPIATVRVRFRDPVSNQYAEQEWVVPFEGASAPLEQASPALRLATVAAAFGEMLSASPYAAEVNHDRLLGLLRGVPEIYQPDPRPEQLARMVQQARMISGQ